MLKSGGSGRGDESRPILVSSESSSSSSEDEGAHASEGHKTKISLEAALKIVSKHQKKRNAGSFVAQFPTFALSHCVTATSLLCLKLVLQQFCFPGMQFVLPSLLVIFFRTSAEDIRAVSALIKSNIMEVELCGDWLVAVISPLCYFL